MRNDFQEKIDLLIEQRVIEAAKKQMTQKLYSISRNLGKQIVAQTIFDNKLEDPWQLEEEMIYDPTNIVSATPDEWDTTDMGFHFDGLRCGINLCITALVYDNKITELKATYNGYLVFAEMEGELRAYAPFPAWEDAVMMFYEAALDREKKRLVESKAVRKEENQKKMSGFWAKFRRMWGR